MLPTHHHLGVENQKDAKDEGTDATVHQMQDFRVEEDGEKPEADKDEERDKEATAKTCEVDASLKGEEGEAKDDDGANASRDHDGIRLVPSSYHAQHEPLTKSEQPQEDDVGGERTPDTRAAGQSNETHKYCCKRDPDQPLVPLCDQFSINHFSVDVFFDVLREDKRTHDGDRDTQLHGQNPVDLANEPPANRLVRKTPEFLGIQRGGVGCGRGVIASGGIAPRAGGVIAGRGIALRGVVACRRVALRGVVACRGVTLRGVGCWTVTRLVLICHAWVWWREIIFFEAWWRGLDGWGVGSHGEGGMVGWMVECLVG